MSWILKVILTSLKSAAACFAIGCFLFVSPHDLSAQDLPAEDLTATNLLSLFQDQAYQSKTVSLTYEVNRKVDVVPLYKDTLNYLKTAPDITKAHNAEKAAHAEKIVKEGVYWTNFVFQFVIKISPGKYYQEEIALSPEFEPYRRKIQYITDTSTKSLFQTRSESVGKFEGRTTPPQPFFGIFAATMFRPVLSAQLNSLKNLEIKSADSQSDQKLVILHGALEDGSTISYYLQPDKNYVPLKTEWVRTNGNVSMKEQVQEFAFEEGLWVAASATQEVFRPSDNQLTLINSWKLKDFKITNEDFTFDYPEGTLVFNNSFNPPTNYIQGKQPLSDEPIMELAADKEKPLNPGVHEPVRERKKSNYLAIFLISGFSLITISILLWGYQKLNNK